MAIRTRTTDGYQQVELTSELLHGRQSGATQQVISTVPCTKHLPFFISILLADIFLFGSVLLFAIHAAKYGDGFSLEQQQADDESPYKQLNLHALIMITAFVYLNGQAITVYKSNYLIKHKSINMLYHFVLHLLTIGAILCGLYMAYNGQEAIQTQQRPAAATVAVAAAAGQAVASSKVVASAGGGGVTHFYSMHSWTGLITIGLFSLQFLFGFFSFFVTLCCRKVSARMRAQALPVHRTFAMIVLCGSVATVISGLTQIARFQLTGTDNRPDYRNLASPATLLINLTGVSVLLSTILIFFITFIFKRRQAHDLPILFKIILLVAQFVEIVLILVVAEFIFQIVTPHVNKVINGQLFANNSQTLTHIFNNATHSINSLIASATQHISNLANLDRSASGPAQEGGGGGASSAANSTTTGSGGGGGDNSTANVVVTTISSIILGSTNSTTAST